MMTVAYWMCYVHISLLVAMVVKGYPSGAPASSCEDGTDLAPSHYFQPSTKTLPYEVDITHFTGQTYVPGQLYNIILRRTSDTDNSIGFKGFMIQGRAVADNSPVGSWQLQESVAKTVCNGDTAATHVDKTGKNSVTLQWEAPPAGTGIIRFRYSFVSTYSTFWANLFTSNVEEAVQATVAPSKSTATPSASNSTDLPSSPTSAPVTNVTTTITTNTTTTDITTNTTTNVTAIDDLVSCQNETGYPVCSPEYCSSSNPKFARCSARVASCNNSCQLTTCGACIYTNDTAAVQWPEECITKICENLKCVVKWSKCANTEIAKFQLEEEEREPEYFECFVPNCY